MDMMGRLLLLAALIGGCLAVARIDSNQPYAAQTRQAAEAAQTAALKAAAASSAAAAHAAAFRKVIKRNVNLLLQDPDLAKYQQYLDILRAHYGIQLPMHPNVATQQSNTGVPSVQSYSVPSMAHPTHSTPAARVSQSYSKYTTAPSAANHYTQQTTSPSQSYYSYASPSPPPPPQSHQPSFPYSNPAPSQQQQQTAASAAYASYANQAAAYGSQQGSQPPPSSYSSYGQYTQQRPQPVQPTEYSYPSVPTQQPTAPVTNSVYSQYGQQPQQGYGGQYGQEYQSGYAQEYLQQQQQLLQQQQQLQEQQKQQQEQQLQEQQKQQQQQQLEHQRQLQQQQQLQEQQKQQQQQQLEHQRQLQQQQERQQQLEQQQQAAAAATHPPQSSSYSSPSGSVRPDPRVVIAYPPSISGRLNPQQPDTLSVPSQSSYPQEYLPRQPVPVQRPVEAPRPRPADPRDYGYLQPVQQPQPMETVQQPRVESGMTGSPLEWWERVSSAIAHEINSVTTTPKYVVPIIPASTIAPRPAPSPIPMQPQGQGYAPSIPSSPLVPINPVEPPRMISQQPPVIYTGESFPTPGDLPTPSFTPPPVPHTSAPPPSPRTYPSPTQSIVHPSSVQTPHASVSATATPVPQPKSIKPTTKEGKAAATSREALAEQIRSLPAVLYTRSSTSKRVEKILRSKGLPLVALYIDKVEGREEQIVKHLEHLTGSATMPYLFICGTYIGSEEHVEEYDKKGQMEQLVEYVCKGKESKKKNKKDKKKKIE